MSGIDHENIKLFKENSKTIAAEIEDVEVEFYDSPRQKENIYTTPLKLHVIRFEIRAAFEVKTQEDINKIMQAFLSLAKKQTK